MPHLVSRLHAFWSEETGAVAVEYVVIASVLGLALVPVLATNSEALSSLFSRVNGYFASF